MSCAEDLLALDEPGALKELERFVAGHSLDARPHTERPRIRSWVGLDRARHQLEEFPGAGVGGHHG